MRSSCVGSKNMESCFGEFFINNSLTDKEDKHQYDRYLCFFSFFFFFYYRNKHIYKEKTRKKWTWPRKAHKVISPGIRPYNI